MPLDSYDDQSAIPAKESSQGKVAGSASLPKATGRPTAVVTSDGLANPRAETKTRQADIQSTPGGQKNVWPSKVDSYTDSEV